MLFTRQTLGDAQVVDALVARLERLTAEAPRRWGRMTAPQMVCHLADVNTGLAVPFPNPNARRREHFKIILGIHSPIPWPKGIRTPARVDQEQGGTPPSGFSADRNRAITSLRTLATIPDGGWPGFHPIFGPLTDWEWRRFAWRHADHHLKQFGL